MQPRYKFSRHRLCICALLAVFGILCGTLAAISYRIDPLSLYHRSKFIPGPVANNSGRIQLTSYSYLAKAKRIALEKPSRILLGSSIVDDGFRVRGSLAMWYDPRPELRTRLLEKSGSAANDYYNAAIRGGGAKEVWDYLQFAYRNNPKLDAAILGVEYGMAYRMPKIPPVPLLHEWGVPFSFTMEYLISPMALLSAYKAFYWEHAGAQRPLYLLAPEQLNLSGALEWIKLLIADARAAEAGGSNGIFTPSATEALAPDKEQEINRFIVTIAYVNGLHHDDLLGLARTNRVQTAEYFRKTVQFCLEHNIDLQVYHSPQPALFWAMLDRFSLSNNADNWYRDMAAQIPVWDFAESLDFSPTIDNFFVLDVLHFKPEAGEIILPAILKRQENVAWRVSSALVDAAIARRKVFLEQWESNHREIMDAIRALPVESLATDPVMYAGPIQSLLPTLMEPEYKGYRVVKILGHYVAVPAVNKPPYDGYRLIAGQYPGMLRAGNLQEMSSTIDNK